MNIFKINKYTKYILLAGVLLFTFGLWAYTKVSIEGLLLTDNILENLAQILSFFAVILFAINFLMATRAYFIEDLFDGLDKMYKSHKMVARLAFTFAWAHPILLMLRRFSGLESIERYFIPGNILVFNLGMGALYVMTLLVLLSITKFLPYHIWKNTHRFMVIVMLFLFVHILNAGGSGEANPILKLWILLWVVIAIIAWIYVEFIYKRWGPVFYYKVKEIKKLGSVIEIYLEPQNKSLRFISGQFVFLSVLYNKKVSKEFHPYTISSSPNEYHIRISSKVLGDYTSTLEHLESGDIVKLIGPYGHFSSERFKEFKNQIWIAGGIGVTPFLSMLAHEKATPSGNNIEFIHSSKTKEESVYESEILAGLEEVRNIEVNFNYDKENGFLTGQKIKEMTKFDIKTAHIMICGPKAMMYALQKQFVELGVPKDQIVFEDFALKPV